MLVSLTVYYLFFFYQLASGHQRLSVVEFEISEAMHCFELRTANVDYFVGEDLMYGNERKQLPPPESGVGAHIARSWETSIRQALLPVTSGSSNDSY